MTQRMPAQPSFDNVRSSDCKHKQFLRVVAVFYWKFVNIETPAVAPELLDVGSK